MKLRFDDGHPDDDADGAIGWAIPLNDPPPLAETPPPVPPPAPEPEVPLHRLFQSDAPPTDGYQPRLRRFDEAA